MKKEDVEHKTANMLFIRLHPVNHVGTMLLCISFVSVRSSSGDRMMMYNNGMSSGSDLGGRVKDYSTPLLVLLSDHKDRLKF